MLVFCVSHPRHHPEVMHVDAFLALELSELLRAERRPRATNDDVLILAIFPLLVERHYQYHQHWLDLDVVRMSQLQQHQHQRMSNSYFAIAFFVVAYYLQRRRRRGGDYYLPYCPMRRQYHCYSLQ